MINDEQAAKDVIDYVLSDDKEHDDYFEQCLENGTNPLDIKNSNHVYAKCLRAMGWKIEISTEMKKKFEDAGIALNS